MKNRAHVTAALRVEHAYRGIPMSRLLMVRLFCLVAVLLMAIDKYSWGELNPPFGILGDQPIGGRTWQFAVALLLTGLLVFVALSAASRIGVTMRVAIMELAGFLAFNCMLLLRDGAARLAEWGYAETSTGLFLVVGGIVVRGFTIRLLAIESREGRPRSSIAAECS